jgi:aryl-alcohol dehydrogenase-like predicted oxidoreductase/predicted N-acetyltransferase YhbS
MVQIRPYRESDAEKVGRLIADTYSAFNLSHASPEELEAFLGPFRHARSAERAHQEAIAQVIRAAMVLVAEENGEIVGVLRGRKDRLHSLFVQGDHHRQGIGRSLVERFEQECLRQGATVVTVAATLYAVPFYLAMGYKRTTGVRSMRSFDGEGLQYQPMKKVLERGERRGDRRGITGVERFRLAPGYTISRLIKGGWQLAGGHGNIEREQALDDMRLYVEAGVTTFDCADIYTGVEELIGAFLRRHRGAMRDGSLPQVQVHTKYVPDLDSLPTLTRRDVAAVIDRSLRRLGVERLDLVQFHWWDYDVPGYVEAALHLQALQKAGKIKQIGMTNFDVPHLAEILSAGVPVVSNQVQYSVLDQRPERDVVELCERHNIALLCYGTVAGGFLSDPYLGLPEPDPPLENRSLTKYKLIIDEFGGWALFQELLVTLKEIARKHNTSVATVATRTVLQKKGVAAAIVGARHARHLPDALRLFSFALDEGDLEAIRCITDQAQGPAGDVYSVERIKGGKHAAIMKTNLNRAP